VLIDRAEVDGERSCVRIERGRITEVAERISRAVGEAQLDAGGGALLPGLHDHHVHLFASAAARESVACGPPDVVDAKDLARALTGAAPAQGWVRGVGYHESVAGVLDRNALDRLGGDRPVRVQHRSGACWHLNSAALARLGLDAETDRPGVERDARGRATGRLFRLDDWLAARIGRRLPDLSAISERFARAGVTGVTDATASNDRDRFEVVREAVASGRIAQRVHVMGDESIGSSSDARVTCAQLKLLLDERDPPDPDDLAARIARAHASGRGVALHCTTRTELVLALAALRCAGPHPADRIEHASVAPPDLVRPLAASGACVVTQPGFVHERGDAYLRDVDARDRDWLYRARGLIDAGIPVGAGTDAPFGALDPWLAVRAAVSRRTRRGEVLGAAEALAPERALALFTTSAEAPGGPPRRVEVGAVADLCLLAVPWAEARVTLSSDLVRATWIAGALRFG
jgi:predicted amidohydrolase YtcJ